MSSQAARKMIIFGGNGFVGSHIAQEAVSRGFNVLVACRSGAPHDPHAAWAKDIHFVRCDALNRQQVYDLMAQHSDTHSVVCSIGALTLDKKMALSMNGDANQNVCAAVFEEPSVRKVAFISAEDAGVFNRLLFYYFYAKRNVEKALLDKQTNLPERSVIMRPAMIYGSRYVAAAKCYIPLGVIGHPLRLLCTPLYALTKWPIFTPAIDVKTLAAATVESCLRDDVTGIQQYPRMVELARSGSRYL